MNETPRLSDKDWSKKNELGTTEELVKYRTPEGPKEVLVTVAMISGAEEEAIEDQCKFRDPETGTYDIADTKVTMLKFCRMFGIDEETYHDIMHNKPGDLRNKLIMLQAKYSGIDLSFDEIENEKNLESPAQ